MGRNYCEGFFFVVDVALFGSFEMADDQVGCVGCFVM